MICALKKGAFCQITLPLVRDVKPSLSKMELALKPALTVTSLKMTFARIVEEHIFQKTPNAINVISIVILVQMVVHFTKTANAICSAQVMNV